VKCHDCHCKQMSMLRYQFTDRIPLLLHYNEAFVIVDLFVIFTEYGSLTPICQ